jgi:hypothetical protein
MTLMADKAKPIAYLMPRAVCYLRVARRNRRWGFMDSLNGHFKLPANTK